MKRIRAFALGLGLILVGGGASAIAETDTRESFRGGVTRESDGYYYQGRRLPDNAGPELSGRRSRDLYYSPRTRYRGDTYYGGRYPYGGYYNPYYAPAPRYAPRQRYYDRRRGRYVYDPAGGGVIRTR
jgi:hypothetical protein